MQSQAVVDSALYVNFNYIVTSVEHTSVPHRMSKLLWLSRWATTLDRILVGSSMGDSNSKVNSMATTDHHVLTVAQIFPLLKKQHYL